MDYQSILVTVIHKRCARADSEYELHAGIDYCDLQT
jgi:hypothetical protein